MASRAGRQPSPTTDPLPAERRGRASDGAQNRPPRQLPGQGPRRREPGDAVGTASGRSVPAGCGHRRPGPMHVRPPTPGALFLAREPHAGRADPERAAPAGCAAVHLYVVRNRRHRRPPPVCISWCPRGDTPHTHTALTVDLADFRDSSRLAQHDRAGSCSTYRCGWRASNGHRAGHRGHRSGLWRAERRV